MDTDCLQEEINVAEQTCELQVLQASTSSALHPNEEDNALHHRKEVKSAADVPSAGVSQTPRMMAVKNAWEKTVDGESAGKSTEGEEEFETVSEVSSGRNVDRTSSPSQNFKSSYAKSLADSYRRASIPVVVSAPKGQFYFKNDEFLSLSSSPVRLAESSHIKVCSLNMNGSRTVISPSSEPQSLPPIIDVVQEDQEQEKTIKDFDSDLPHASIYERLLDEDIFVSYDQLHHMCEKHGGNFSLQDWHNLGSIITNDGRKLIKLSDLKVQLKQQGHHHQILAQNGHVLPNGSDRESQIESLLVERGQLGDRVEQLCRVLSDRDATIQRLEEDLLRIRMECQRLMVDNRSLKSSLGQGTPQQTLKAPDASSHLTELQQQVQLLTAQLTKAERSRHTYEAATRQLVEFLHTVNSTLNSASYLNTSTSPAISPTCSLHSTTSTTTTRTSSSIPAEGDGEDDPPYRLTQANTPPMDSPSRLTSGPLRSNSEAMRKAGSVWALPTHTFHMRKVSRAASTNCVASAALGSQSEPTAAAAKSSPESERSRTHTADFLASRARELLSSLKSLMRSDSVLKLNLEPKKSSSSVSSGRSRSSNRSMKFDVSTIGTSSDIEGNKTITSPATVTTNPPSNETGDIKRPKSLDLNMVWRDKDKISPVHRETDASLTVSSNLDNTSTTTTVPRIGTGQTREGLLQPQSAVEVNGNPQPLSLMVVGEHSCTPDDHHFSSLPIRTRISRTLTDSDHRLVWV